jgi:threonine/homoserine/homoserine lactone efflux protein
MTSDHLSITYIGGQTKLLEFRRSVALTDPTFLGLIFNIVGAAWNLLVAFVAGHVAKGVQRENLCSLWVNRALGGMFIYLGFRVAVARQG